MSDSKKSTAKKSTSKKSTAKRTTSRKSEATPKTSSSLERRVERIEAAFVKHFNVDLAEHDATDEAARARGAEVEAGKEPEA